MAIADTITSMQTHTSNAYTMIGYGTDLTGINKNLENLSPSIFNAFLEALRTPDTLFTNLPKKSGTGANITLNDTANAPMRIELGASELTQAGTPTPSSPQDIHTISGNNTIKVFKNLIDKDNPNLINNYALTEPYNNKGWISENDDYIVYIPCKKNTQYNITKIQSDRLRISTTIDNPTTLPQTYDYYNCVDTTQANYTTNSTANYLCIFFRRYSDTLSMQDILNTLIVYEVNTSQEADIDLGDLEYSKIRNYADVFYRATDSDTSLISGKWYLKKNIGKVVLDGSEDWVSLSALNTTDYYAYYYANSIFATPSDSVVGVISNYFIGDKRANRTANKPNCWLNNSASQLYVHSPETTISNFQTWLSNNNTKVDFIRANAEYILLNDTLQTQLDTIESMLLSYKGQTSISQVNNDLSFELSVSAIEEL